MCARRSTPPTEVRLKGDVEVMHLPKMGIKGNSHMLMQDRNSLDLADLILQWIDRHAGAVR